MGFNVFHNLPAHILLVHFVVVLVPLTSLAVVVCALSARWTRRLGAVLPLLGLVTLGMVPVTQDAGDWLEARVPDTALVERHSALGDSLTSWAVGLFVVAVGIWWVNRRTTSVTSGSAGSAASVVSAAIRVPAARSGSSSVPLPASPVRHQSLDPGSAAGSPAGGARGPYSWAGARWFRVLVIVVALTVAGGASWDIYLIGDSGAKAAWTGNFSPKPLHQETDG